MEKDGLSDDALKSTGYILKAFDIKRTPEVFFIAQGSNKGDVVLACLIFTIIACWFYYELKNPLILLVPFIALCVLVYELGRMVTLTIEPNRLYGISSLWTLKKDVIFDRGCFQIHIFKRLLEFKGSSQFGVRICSKDAALTFRSASTFSEVKCSVDDLVRAINQVQGPYEWVVVKKSKKLIEITPVSLQRLDGRGKVAGDGVLPGKA